MKNAVSPSKVAIRARTPNFHTKLRTHRSKWRISSRTSPSFSLVGKPNSFSDSAEKHKNFSTSCRNHPIQTIGLAGAPQLTASDTWRVLLKAIPVTFRESNYSTILYTVTCGENSLRLPLHRRVWHIWTRRREIEIAGIWTRGPSYLHGG